MDSLMIPSSIQRVRAFLIERCGMKVKPWASAEETLAALHRTLVTLRGCDIFWTSLRGLLETLARDLKARQEAAPGTLLDNEVLDDQRYCSLLDEIRAALAAAAAGEQAAGFRGLAAMLSASALGLLLFLGGAASIGCAGSPLHNAGSRTDAAVTDLPAPSSDAPTVRITLPDGPPLQIILPDVRIEPNPVTKTPDAGAATVGPDGGAVTIADIMASCNLDSRTQQAVLACLAGLRASWSTGMAELFAGASCSDVANDLDCFTYGQTCTGGGAGTEFDPATTRVCQPVIIYIGVRFV